MMNFNRLSLVNRCFGYLLLLYVSSALAQNYRWSITSPKRGKPAPGNRLIENYKLSDSAKNSIVNAHNLARSGVRPAAANMRKITWDNDLEKLANDYSKKCIFGMNPNKKLKRFRRVEELHFVSSGKEYDEMFGADATIRWADEKQYYNYQRAQCQRGRTCNRYTQIAWAATFKVGCGISKCSAIMVNGQTWRDVTLMVCDYTPGGNWINSAPYEAGPVCSSCHSTDTCVDNLCTNPGRDSLQRPVAKWSPWTSWTPCSITCGLGGITKRKRYCNTFVNKDCGGRSSEFRFLCSRSSCSSRNNPQPTAWNRWGPWSKCSKSCGGGRKIKRRTCSTGKTTDCQGRSWMYIRCNAAPCPTWQTWRQWGPCSKSCGSGIRTRTRACNTGNNKDCRGSATERGSCASNKC